MNLILSNPFDRLVGVHWAGDDLPPGAVGIFQATQPASIGQSPAGDYWPFQARLWTPGAERWNTLPTGGPRAAFIVGKYQPGLGGDYAYSSDRRLDPHVGGAGTPSTFLLPGDISDDLFSDCYLWHCGNLENAVWQTLIVNLAKIATVYGDSDGPPSVVVEIAGLSFPASWEYRVYGYPGTGDTGNFGADELGGVTYGAELLHTQTGTGFPQIVTGLRIPYPPSI